MILGYHFIFSAYGFWLPNDPRGSWSKVVREYEIACFGPATKVTATCSVAAAPHDHSQRLAAKKALRYSPVRFSGLQARIIANGFTIACEEGTYRALAFAMMPDHAHLLVERHQRHVDQIASHLKAKATKALNDADLNPMSRHVSAAGRVPSPWGRKYWCPFIDNARYMKTAIEYINDNPLKSGLKAQKWSFVKPYRG
ncbi:MAG: transposase [Planctomycetota bacterium]